jgi:hypothetical protein
MLLASIAWCGLNSKSTNSMASTKIPMIAISQQEALRWFKSQREPVPLSDFREERIGRRPCIGTVRSMVKPGIVTITPKETEEDSKYGSKVELTELGKKMARSV